MASLRKRGRKWYFTFIDHDGRKVERKGCTDKRATEDMAKAAEVRATRIRNGEISIREADLPEQERRPLEEHIQGFQAMLKAKRSTPKHIHMTTRFIREVARLAGAKTTAGLTAAAVTAALLKLQADGLSARTVNSYLRGVKSFTRWLAKEKRVREDALTGLSMLNQAVDRLRVRRPLSPEEAARLIEAAETGPKVMGMTGPDRALLYGVMLATGLRKSEAASIRPESFSLNGEPATVTIEASDSKRRKQDTLPLPSSLTARIRRWLANKPEGEPVFNLPDKPHKMFYRDLARAQIPQETHAGTLDLHSLRHNFVSAIVAGGANVKTAQELARHSTPKLTFDVYAHARLHDIVGSVERLPDPFQAPQRPEKNHATGTDGRPISKLFAEYLPNVGDASSRVVSDSDAMPESIDHVKMVRNPYEGQKLTRSVGLGRGETEARPVGFEPTTFGFEVRDSIR